MVWQPHVRSNGEWIATKILQGIFGAPIESLAEITVSDVVSHYSHKVTAYDRLIVGRSSSPTNEASSSLSMLSHSVIATASLHSSWASSTMDKGINGYL